MDEIERQVQLPQGAQTIDAYARYYAFDGAGHVVAVYLEPTYYVRADGDPASSMRADGLHLRSGRRQWRNDYRKLPGDSSSGCSEVHVLFDPGSGRVEEVRCNGEA